MADFCGNCGAASEGGGFCHNCGQSLSSPTAGTSAPDAGQAPPAPPTAMPPAAPQQPAQQPPAPPAYQQGPQGTPPPAQQPGPQPGPGAPPGMPPAGAPASPPGYPAAPGQPPGYPPQQPRAPRINPFLGWPISDYVRDGAAAFCLFACLGMTWEVSADPKGGEQWWVVISVLLAVASIAVPYLTKAQLIPGWSPLHYRLAKLGLCVPFLASVLAAIINELIHLGDGSGAAALGFGMGFGFEGGIGVAVGMGLAGVALAAQPRQADDPMNREDRIWNQAAAGVGIAAVALGTLMFVGFLIDTDGILDEVPGFFALLLVTLVMLLVMAAWPLAGMLGGSAAWRRVFATSTFTLIGVALLAHADDGTALFFWPQIEKWNSPVGATFLIGAAAGLSVARSMERRAGEQTEPVAEWAKTASAALLVTAGGAGVSVIALILGIVQDDDELSSAIVVAVLVLAIAGCAGFAATLTSDARKNRILILGLIAGSVVLGLVAMGIVNGQDLNIERLAIGPSIPVTGWVVAAWVTLPLLAAYALTVPKPVRTTLGPLLPQQPQHPQQYGYPPQQGQPYPGQQPPPPPGYPQQGPPQQGHPQQGPPHGQPPQGYPQQGPPAP